MIATWFFMASLAFGFAVTALIPMRMSTEKRLWLGVPVGLAVGGLLGFGLAWVFGLSDESVAMVAALLTMGVLIILARRLPRQVLRDDVRQAPGRLLVRRHWLLVAIYIMFGILLSYIMAHALIFTDGAVAAAFTNVWGDWNLHLSQVTGFVYGDNIPPQQPAMSGERLTYPFLGNFVSAMLLQGGWSLPAAMLVPGVFLALSALGLLMTFSYRVAGRGAAALAPWLFFLGGGLGFVNFFFDAARNDQSWGYFLTHLPANYTQTFQGSVLSNINWLNPIFAYVVPQRAFLFGLPLVLGILWVLFEGIEQRRRGLMLAAGLLAMLLPLVQTHGLLFLGLLTPALVYLSMRRFKMTKRAVITLWLPFVAPILVVGLPQLLWLTWGISTAKYFRWQLGWTAGQDNVVWFWLKNMGLFLPLLGVALVRLRGSHHALWNFTVAVGSVFVIANLFVFQPWDWDNSKLLVYWFIFSVPMVGLFLTMLWRQSRAWRWAAAAMMVSLVLAGSLDVSKVVAWRTSQLPLFSAEESRMAEAVRARTASDAIFLSGSNADNPISGLAGRKLVMGYTGWLWSYGLDYLPRERDVASMLSGAPEAAALLQEYGVDYVMIGAAERSAPGYRLDEAFYQQRYALWGTFGDTKIYDLSQPAESASASR